MIARTLAVLSLWLLVSCASPTPVAAPACPPDGGIGGTGGCAMAPAH